MLLQNHKSPRVKYSYNIVVQQFICIIMWDLGHMILEAKTGSHLDQKELWFARKQFFGHATAQGIQNDLGRGAGQQESFPVCSDTMGEGEPGSLQGRVWK